MLLGYVIRGPVKCFETLYLLDFQDGFLFVVGGHPKRRKQTSKTEKTRALLSSSTTLLQFVALLVVQEHSHYIFH